MTIAQKLSLLLMSSMAALIALIVVGNQNATQIAHTQAQLQLVEQLRLSALSMRSVGKDFVIRPTNETPEKHTQHYEQFVEQMHRLDQTIVGDTSTLAQQTSAYRERFLQTVARQKLIGFTPETGLYGELRAAVHNVEKKLQPITTTAAGAKLLADVLLLRRHEKDFMLRRDAKYADNLVKDIKILETDLAKSPLDDDDITKLQALINTYQTSFLALVDNEKIVGIKDVKGLRDTMREQGEQMEENLTAFANAAKTQAEIIETQAFWTNIVLTSVIVLFLLGLTWNTRRAILNPVNNIINQMQAITQTGRLSNRVPVDSNDELGKIATSFNRLLDAIQNAVKETNHVLGSMAEGKLDERMRGNYAGDLGQMAHNVNTSADGIVNIVNQIRDAMNALYEGQFDKPINKDAPGEFGIMLSNAADTLDAIQGIITELNLLAAQMNAGNFNSRIHVNARGNMLTMKTNLNDAMAALDTAIMEVNRVMQAQSTGDLTQQITGNYQGQLKSLSHAINSSASQLLQIVSRSIGVSHMVNDGANQVSQGATDLSMRIQEQAASIEQSCATMTEMSASVATNSGNNAQIATLIRQVEQKSGNGVLVMKQTIDAMQSIQNSSHQIGDIVSIIDGIAFQTNLLALNAAVEAARAGEHGRGFAVVASEVRALAGKSAAAAKDIKTLITASVSRVKTGTELADKSGVMLNEIEQSVKHVAEMMDGMAHASQEQNHAIAQVNKAMHEIDRVTQENAALVEETTAAADSLHQVAEELRSNMDFFNTRKGGRG
jgi:methyl-accepting chemotaxis protein